MSLYNMLFGTNPLADMLLAIIDVDAKDIPRFRDCYIDEDHIVIYTRTGGGNREDYEVQNTALTLMPGYIRDEDDSFDSTFAHFHFEVPKYWQKEFDLIRTMNAAQRDPRKLWPEFLAKLKDPAKRDDPEVVAALKKLAPVIQQLNDAMEGKGPNIIEV